MIATRAHLRTLLRATGIPAACTLVLLATACGSNKEPAADSGAPSAATTAAPAANTNTASVKPGTGSDDVSNWEEAGTPPVVPASATSAALADPDAVIGRYQRECPKETQTPQCRSQRLDVEAIFLDALMAVRATNAVIDPRWYRAAAASETPQLACIGVNELSWDPKRTAADEALIAQALDSPYRAVRNAVSSNWRKLPTALTDAMKRGRGYDTTLTGACLDSARDPVASIKWAGGYPGAKFRPIASSASLRWFTTPDPPEKVIAWFEARGKPAHSMAQMNAEAQAKFMEEMTRLSTSPDPGSSDQDVQEKMMAMMANQGADSQWDEPFRTLEGIGGSIRYVKIGAQQAIAIFRDDFFDATSIVAPKPKEPIDLHPDMEAAKEEAEMRSIFGY